MVMVVVMTVGLLEVDAVRKGIKEQCHELSIDYRTWCYLMNSHFAVAELMRDTIN
jgi:hypothetical protein